MRILAKTILNEQRLKELLNYNPDTGIFTWKIKYCRKVTIGSIAGHKVIGRKDYTQIRIDSVLYSAHRLAWFYIYSEWPDYEIDHVNRNKSDNRIVNLRLSCPGPQQFNTGIFSHNSSGFKGVSWHKATKTWRAYIQIKGKFIGLGYFKNIDDAVTARKNKEELHNLAIEKELQQIAPLIFGEYNG